MSRQIKVDYNMEVQEPWFSKIGEPDFTKRKTVEGRVGDAKKHSHLVGKIVKINTNGRHLYVKIPLITHYDTLEDYLQAEGWRRAAPHANSYLDAIEKYQQVLTVNKENKSLIKVFGSDRIKESGGINALHLELLSPIATDKQQNSGTGSRTASPVASNGSRGGPNGNRTGNSTVSSKNQAISPVSSNGSQKGNQVASPVSSNGNQNTSSGSRFANTISRSSKPT